MKKTLLYTAISLILLIALAIFVLPWGFGILIKNRYAEMLNTVSKSGGATLTLRQYDRHWFNATAVIEIKPTSATLLRLKDWSSSSNAEPMVFIVNQSIEHGPFLKLTSAQGKTRWLFGQALIKSQTQPSLGTIDSITLIRLGGSILSAVTAPVLHYSNPQKRLLLIMKGLEMSLNLSADLNHIKVRFNIPQLDLKTADFQQSVNNFDAQYNLRKSDSGLLWGEKTTAIDQVLWQTGKDHAQAKITGLFVRMRSSERHNKVTYAINSSLTNFAVGDQQYGSQQLDMEMNDLDLATVQAMAVELKKLQQVDSIPPTEMGNYMNLIAQLIHKGLTIHIKQLLLNTPWGAPQMSGKFTWAPQTTEEISPGLQLAYLNASARLLLPPEFLTQSINHLSHYLVGLRLLPLTPQTVAQVKSNPDYIPQQIIAWWLENRWLTQQGSGYSVDLDYKNQTLMVNGQSLQGKSIFPTSLTQTGT